jgi:hypothetical protein
LPGVVVVLVLVLVLVVFGLLCSTDHEPVKDFNPSGEMIDRQSARQPGASDRCEAVMR